MKKKIVFVLPNSIGGVAIYNIELIKLLGLNNYNVVVILVNRQNKKSEVNHLSNIFAELDVTLRVIDDFSHFNRHVIINKILSEIRNADIVFSSDLIPLLSFNKGVLKCKLFHIVHSNDLSVDIPIACKFAGIIDKVICVSAEIEKNLLKLLPDHFIHKVAYYPLALSEPGEIGISNVNSDQFTILFVGRFNSVKGVEILLEIGHEVLNSKMEINFIFITDGKDEEIFKADWPLNKRTQYFHLISNSEVQQIMLKANVLLMPSRIEGFPITLVEAMRRGLVPVVSDIKTGFSEIIINGRTGFKCDLSSGSNFLNKIEILKNDRKYLRGIQIECLKIVHEKFNSVNNIQPFKNLLSLKFGNKIYCNYNDYLGILDNKFIPNFITIFYRLYFKKLSNFLLKRRYI